MILDKFPKVLWINLDQSYQRRNHMEILLNRYYLNHTRIRAVDGFNKEELKRICVPHPFLSQRENACTCSHILALKYFVENMEDDRVIVFEDDVSFEFLQYIPYCWSRFEKELPDDYGLVQLAITNDHGDIPCELVKIDPTKKFFCSAAYLIKKSTAQGLLERYFSNKSGKIDLALQQYPAADTMITSVENVYSIPIFTYLTTDSIIHPIHLHIHNRSKKRQQKQWIELIKLKNRS